LDETVGVVAVAAVLSAGAVTALAFRTNRADPATPERLIGELGLARWAGVLIAGVGGVSLGLAIAHRGVALAHVDAALGVIFIGLGGVVLQREPREGLVIAATALLSHALLSIAHRPGWLPADMAPHWFTVGAATYDVYLAGLCFWGRRR
jgi:hypothetical protein